MQMKIRHALIFLFIIALVVLGLVIVGYVRASPVALVLKAPVLEAPYKLASSFSTDAMPAAGNIGGIPETVVVAFPGFDGTPNQPI